MSAYTKHINKQIKSLLNGCVIYVETEHSKEVTGYLKANLDEIKALFNTKYKSFIIASNNDLETNLKEVITYFYPRLNLDRHNLSVTNSSQYLLELFGVNDEVKRGLLSIDNETTFTDLSNIKIENLKAFLSQYVSSIYVEEYDDLPLYGNNNYDENITLDDETKKRIDTIFEQFRSLKENGSFLSVLPIIENYIKENNTTNIDDLSALCIDENYNIYLSDYNNLEIKLSHLTKSVYLLFLNHPEGILLQELPLYKNELLTHYKNVSNRLDFDKMNESITDLIDTKSNAIYVHLSRIKSAFSKILHHSIAQYYYIDGGKNKPKRIDLRSDLIIYANPNKNNSAMDDLLEMDIDE